MKVSTCFVVVVAISLVSAARAGDASEIAGDPVVEAPTLRCLGAYWVIRGDENRNARVEVSFSNQTWCFAETSITLPGG